MPAPALVAFCKHVGVAKVNGTHELGLLDFFVRDWLNKRAERRMAVIDPVRVVIENWPTEADGTPRVEWLDAINNPEDDAAGTRRVPFTGELWIQREDFLADPPKKFFRLAPGREVRLRYGFFVTCTGFDADDDGRVTEIRCTYDPETRGGNAPDGRKVKGTIHWVSATHAVEAEVRLFEPLFTEADPAGVDDDRFADILRKDSKTIVRAWCEPSLGEAVGGQAFQFERVGYFYCDPEDSRPDAPVFHRTVTLKDAWKKQQARR